VPVQSERLLLVGKFFKKVYFSQNLSRVFGKIYSADGNQQLVPARWNDGSWLVNVSALLRVIMRKILRVDEFC